MNKFFNFFNIELVSWGESYSFFFIGPAHHTADSFKGICDQILPDATLKAIANVNNSPIEEYASLSMVDIIENLEEFLEVQGFTRIHPKAAIYSGSGGRVSDEEAIQLGVAGDSARYYSATILQDYEWDEESGDRRSY